MIHDRIITLRKAQNITQEMLAELIGVSRQTISKWETGESIPDIEKAQLLAKAFNITLDTLVEENTEDAYFGSLPPRGKHAYGLVRVGDKGQIVIPARARKQFGIEPGSNLLLLGDDSQGLALLPEKYLLDFMRTFQTLPKEEP